MKQLLHFQKIISRYVQNSIPNVPPNITICIPKIKGVKAIAFDVYGTLLHSAVREISTCAVSKKIELEFPHLKLKLGSKVISDILQCEIRAQQATKHEQGIRYPEVDIVRVWEKILQREKLFSGAVTDYNTITECAMETALYYELQVNPVSLMSHALNIINTLHKAGITLGIVSNAQFYTAHILEYLLCHADNTEYNKRKYEKLLSVFSTCTWSYKLGESKPSMRLYKTLLCAWSYYKPHEIIFIGNDMRNDIAPCAELGIKTVLFAGDAQSYRPRENMQELASIKPNGCITNLMSITDIIGIT